MTEKDPRDFWGNEPTRKAREKLAKHLGESQAIYDRDCQYCQAPLAFTVYMGKLVALDLRAHVYNIIYEKSETYQKSQSVRTTLAFVDHWFLCPGARDKREEWFKAQALERSREEKRDVQESEQGLETH